ncbi:MAG: class I SAM-dependent RNA methyltransferase [Candidatus Promineifilaceae bacterium]|nr:class I SAM-dependent RNA methyltransferase [Candidatus Promineifilaceae bacterium]
MTETLTLQLTDMAHGGDALGRDEDGRVIFVPYAIPGEKVRVEVVDDQERFAHARLLEVLEPSPERAEPRCPHFGVCGACHWQHMSYEAQLKYKQEVVGDQLQRIGRLQNVEVQPTLANPEPWTYGVDVSFRPTPDGENLGFWSPVLDQVMEIEECHIIRPLLLELFQDLDMAFPGLQRLTLRVGDDEALLVALEVEDLEPPELVTDFPVSVTVLLPDGTAANLVGDNHIVQAVKGRDFRVTAGSFFYTSPPAAALLVDTVLRYAALTGAETVLDAYCGVGMLTAFLADEAAQVIGVEAAPDAVADAALNLEGAESAVLYEGSVEAVLPEIAVRPEVMVVDPPPDGLSREVVEMLEVAELERLIYVSSDPATLGRDARQLHDGGYELIEVQPIDMLPQTFRVLTVSLWEYPEAGR